MLFRSIFGTISPGNSPGTLNQTGDQTWEDGGSCEWEIDDTTGWPTDNAGVDPGWDLINIDGSLLLGSLSPGGFTIDIISLDHNAGHSPDVSGNALNFLELNPWGSIDYSFEIVRTTGGISGFDASLFTLNSSAFTNEG